MMTWNTWRIHLRRRGSDLVHLREVSRCGFHGHVNLCSIFLFIRHVGLYPTFWYVSSCLEDVLYTAVLRLEELYNLYCPRPPSCV